ncbi:MAG: hypothetical protein OXN44_12345 [Acidimicrobiaceae bacterium]|nr:hypothetical protein [Acidimicrobiaceae bacterium]MDE0608177.1 hypothetical protein [Acidimicrobiaceae bacterium]
MAKPTNVLLSPALRAVAKRRANERGLSVSAYIRELIRSDDEATSATSGEIAPLIGMLGTGAEPTDIARHKHEMVQQAFSQDLDSKRRARTGHE